MSPAPRRFLRDHSAQVGAVLLAIIVLCALFGPWLAPYPGDAFGTNPLDSLLPPSATHWLGTDSLGRDVLSRTILGARQALTVSLVTIAGSILVGVPLGLCAGYVTGAASQLIMRLTDLFLAVPQLILALAFAAVMPPSSSTAILALTLTYWPYFCRIVYGEARRVRASVFIDALECVRCPPWRIVFMHLLPNVAPAIIVRATIGMGVTILTAAALGFLGLASTPPTPEWGLMIAESRPDLPNGWWQSTFPGLAIFFTVLAFNLLGDSVGEVIDPRQRRSS